MAGKGKLPVFLSLFSGAGGLDLGLEQAGWDCRYAADVDQLAVASLQANVGLDLGRGRKALSNACVEQADIRQVQGADMLTRAGVRRGDALLLAGGPPCQSWSSAGHQKGFADPRGRLFHDFVRVAGELDSRWLLLENVRGFLTARGADGVPGSALASIRNMLLRAGFQTTVALLNAADYGVAQRRVRLFLVGFRKGDAPPFPSPTHAKGGCGGLPPWLSLGEAVSELLPPLAGEVVRPSGKMAADLVGIRPGAGVKSMGKAERTRPGGHWGYRQGGFVADPTRPARTVTANQQQDWLLDPTHGLRRLSPRECAALQGFPADWRFLGNDTARYRLVGNAVPPPLACAMGRALLVHKAGDGDGLASPLLDQPLPLSPRLAYHVSYTTREEDSNGASRRLGPSRRASRALDVPCP